ncbi:hypothetical protein [Nitrincola sp. MINF-07-Sa-05]|uniref:hypothetical protein n=1 Tax=Nitrincola salilacus TaxID=3400273 RepID=UPI003917D3EC
MSTFVKDAASLFRQGQYEKAKQCYIQAASRYGEQLFKANIALCDRYISKKPSKAFAVASLGILPAAASQDPVVLANQLQQTQALLEKYFIRAQELEYQLKDTHSA